MMLFDSLKLDRPVLVAPPDNPARGPARSGSRRGSLLAEVGIATVVLVIVMGMTARVVQTVAQERRAALDRQRGVLEVGNLMERISAYDFDQLTPEFVGTIVVSDRARQSIRECELTIDVSEGDGPRAGSRSAKRVMIRLRWKGRSGQWQAPVRLTSWIEPGRKSP